ncbi:MULTISPECIES: 3-oxoadipate enol-lactonase [Kaistia]|uniref:3-oxoadipate enol-lactonase n=1 Tax=Kaistia nematophila TaxID=2994654 RepID=A0A9X3IKC1_9HYPH|nr:3-oxoadipate enol-lactonase [Kaistia nematophila]MCX5569313.1 3-oxoadipate enol-lactonase [Kaistia nematophila]
MPLIAMDDGIRLNVEADPDNGKPALLLANALGTNLGMWNDQLPAFREHFRVIRFDDRGHGGSDVPDTPYTIDRLGRDARSVLDAVGVESAHIVGLSKGGMVGAWLAANKPDYVDKLVICASAPHLPPRDMWEGRAKTARNEGLTALVDSVIGRWFREGFRAGAPQVVARIREMILGTPAEGYAACCEALGEMDLRDDLELIQSPTLVVCADHDASVQPAKAREWVADIDGARMEVIQNAAHLCNVEQPEAFNRVVLDFLRA